MTCASHSVTLLRSSDLSHRRFRQNLAPSTSIPILSLHLLRHRVQRRGEERRREPRRRRVQRFPPRRLERLLFRVARASILAWEELADLAGFETDLGIG